MLTRATWETAPLRFTSFTHGTFMTRLCIMIQSNILSNQPEMEDSHTYLKVAQRTLEKHFALHCMKQAGPDHQICGLSERKSRHSYTLHLPTLRLWYQRRIDLSQKGTGKWMFQVIYRLTGRLQILHFLTWCHIVTLCHVSWASGCQRWAMWQIYDAV